MKNGIFRAYNRVKFQSEKLGKSIWCNSLLLRDYLILLEWDTQIKSYELWPFKISYIHQGQRRIFRPHLLFETVEEASTAVWLRGTQDEPGVDEPIVRFLTNFCEKQEVGFLVRHASDIRQDPFFSNLTLLRRYNRCELTVDHIFLCGDFFDKFTTPLFGDLVEFLLGRDCHPATPFALLSQQVIGADLNSNLINENLPIQLTKSINDFENRRFV
jgi:hypothetical protein